MAKPAITFTEIEPGIAYEYAVIQNGRRIGRVRKQETTTYPFIPNGRWIADDGTIQRSGFTTRQAAAEWLIKAPPPAKRIPPPLPYNRTREPPPPPPGYLDGSGAISDNRQGNLLDE